MDVIERIERDLSQTMDGGKILSEKDLSELLQLAKIGQQMRWIPVSERLPEGIYPKVDILIKDSGVRITDVSFNEDHKIFNVNVYGKHFGIDKVTHWRPVENDKPGDTP